MPSGESRPAAPAYGAAAADHTSAKTAGPAGFPGSGEPDVRPGDPADHYWQYCVNCGTMLEGRKCKLICPRCGFYHSCSEP